MKVQVKIKKKKVRLSLVVFKKIVGNFVIVSLKWALLF